MGNNYSNNKELIKKIQRKNKLEESSENDSNIKQALKMALGGLLIGGAIVSGMYYYACKDIKPKIDKAYSQIEQTLNHDDQYNAWLSKCGAQRR
jgi:hypothetical protein